MLRILLNITLTIFCTMRQWDNMIFQQPQTQPLVVPGDTTLNQIYPLFRKIMLTVAREDTTPHRVPRLHLKPVLRITPGHILVPAQEHRVRLIYRNQAKIRPNH